MRIGFALPLILFILLFVGLFVSLFALQPMLTVPYLCFAPWVGFWLGRASLGAVKSRVAVLSQREAQIIQQARTRSS